MGDAFVRYALVAAGSAIGGCARYGVGLAVARRSASLFPWGTFLVNVTGCFAIGLFMAFTVERLPLDTRWRLLFAVGVCGGYTTFSSFAYETSKLVDGREYAFAAANVVGSALAGLAAVWIGGAAAKWVW
jgi:CrcB protein